MKRRHAAKLLSVVDRLPPKPLSWSPEQMATDLLEDIRAGTIKPVKMVVHFFEENADGRLVPNHWRAGGMSDAEQIALSVLMQAQALDEWKQ